MCGQAKSDIVRTMVEQEFRKHLRNEDYRDAFDRIVKGLFELPNDTNIQPNEIGASCLAYLHIETNRALTPTRTDVAGACHRLLQTMPLVSPFCLVRRCKTQAAELRAYWEEHGGAAAVAASC
jgi:hypothetical protein